METDKFKIFPLKILSKSSRKKDKYFFQNKLKSNVIPQIFVLGDKRMDFNDRMVEIESSVVARTQTSNDPKRKNVHASPSPIEESKTSERCTRPPNSGVWCACCCDE